MSALLLSLSSKLSLRKLAPLRSHTLRTFSSTTTTTTNPYLMYCATTCRDEYPELGLMTELQLLMFDPAKQEYFIDDKTLPKEMVESRLVGSSHGWGVYLKSPDSIVISDLCIPSSSPRKIIPLHPRKPMNGSQTELASGVAMSSCPQEQGCVTAVKYTGRLVTIDTPGLESKGNLIFMSPQLYDYFEHAMLMYSKRDQRFYMPSSGGHHLWSWEGLPSTIPRFHELRFHNLPRFSPSELQLLDSCYRTHHLVESPSGQRFLVKWYAPSFPIKKLKYNCGDTKLFMVYREEEDMNMCYTEDIGDLCIFLGHNEPFCLEASSFPGLHPNSIYFVREGFGVYDIATRTPNSFNPKSPPPFSKLPPGQSHLVVSHWAPHWIPPLPL